MRRLPALTAIGIAMATLSVPAHAAPLCAADLNGNGDAADPGETAACSTTAGGGWQCPIEAVTCTLTLAGAYACQLGERFLCEAPASGGIPTCSPHACADAGAGGIVDDPVVDDPGAPADGVVDAAGDCLGTVQLFAGRAVRCRPPGLKTSFSNCCKDKGRIVKDGMGSSITSIGTKITVAKQVFTGMQAAYTAFRAGATAAEAASAGAHAIVVGLDPTSVAISIAINYMIEVLLQGCDAQDMETGMLRGSGMCHEVGTYCSSEVLGVCVQKAKSHCCFNTKLGRIIQEQGRPQLKGFNAIGWGPVKHPDCRGFTSEEFQALNFSRIDLSEYYDEISARADTDIQTDMRSRVDAYMHVMGR